MKCERKIPFTGIITSLLLAIVLPLSCSKEAPTVTTQDVTSTPSGGTTAGYYYPSVTGVYPPDGTTTAPVDTEFMIIFNMPVNSAEVSGGISISSSSLGNLTETTHYTITTDTTSTTYARIAFIYGGAYPLPDNETVTITINNTITDVVNGVALNNPQTVSFSVPLGATPDTTPPTVDTGTRTPADGATGIALTGQAISIQFNETGEIDPTSINSSTFYLSGGTYSVPATYSYNAATNTATMTLTATLEPNISPYTVNITTGIRDLSGNYLSAGDTWTFDTVTAITDPDGSNPTIDTPVVITSATTTSGSIRWITSESTNYTLNWGRNSDMTEAPVSDAGYSAVHSYTLGSLTAGQRYWISVDYEDYVGNAGTTSAAIQFNTLTPETPVDIHSGAGNQGTPRCLTNRWGVTNKGAFLFWDDDNSGSNHIYGQRYDASVAAQWNAGSPLGLFTEGGQTYSYVSSSEDQLGGTIVLATRATGGLTWAKRLDASGTFDWGYAATDTGLQVHSAAISNVQAVPVYTGMLTDVLNGNVEMASLSLANPVYEDNDFGAGTTLFDLVSDDDVIYNTTGTTGTTIIKTGSDHEYILGNTASIAVNGNTYIIADGNTDFQNNAITVTNHTMNIAGAKNVSGTTLFTQHGFTPPGWFDAGDIVYNTNTSTYGRVVTVDSTSDGIFNATAPYLDYLSGTESANRPGHLIDGQTDFTAVPVNQYDLADNAGTYALVLTVTETDLELESDIFPNGTEAYDIHAQRTSGTTDGTTAGELVDSSEDFTALSIAIGDIVVRSDASYQVLATATVNDLTNAATGRLGLSADIFVAGQIYYIYNSANLTSGTATSNKASHLIDGTATWTDGADIVAVDDLIMNVTDSTYALVLATITDTDLTLASDIFPDAGNDTYRIYSEHCTTHTTGSDRIERFFKITLDHDISAADGHVLHIYNDTGTTETFSAFPANPLYEMGNDLTAQGLADGDIAVNASTGTFTTLDVSTYLQPWALSLTANIFSVDNQGYNLLQFAYANTDSSDIIDSGLADTDTTNHLVDAGQFGSVSAGDIACNVTDGTYAMVTAAASGDLTLSWDAFPAGNEPYLIISQPGVLYVWEEGGNIRGRVIGMKGSPPVELRAAYDIVVGGSNPHLVSDDLGNAVIIYEDSSSQIQAMHVNGYGTSIGSAAIDTQTATAETIIDVITENSGSANDGIVVLYKKGGNLCAQRLDWGLIRQYDDTNGQLVTGLVNSQHSAAFDAANDAVLVAFNSGDDIYVTRAYNGGRDTVQITNLLGSTQQNPQIMLTAGNTALVFWGDNRFLSYASYGIFGMRLVDTDQTTFEKDTTWYANDGGTSDDDDGVAVILNSFNENWPLPLLLSIDDGNEGMLIWHDYQTQASDGSDLKYINPITGETLPYP